MSMASGSAGSNVRGRQAASSSCGTVGEQESGGEYAGLALDQGQAVVAVVGAQLGGAVLLRHEFQADDVDGEPHRVLQVGRAGADVGDVVECDHSGCSSSS